MQAFHAMSVVGSESSLSLSRSRLLALYISRALCLSLLFSKLSLRFSSCIFFFHYFCFCFQQGRAKDNDTPFSVRDTPEGIRVLIGDETKNESQWDGVLDLSWGTAPRPFFRVDRIDVNEGEDTEACYDKSTCYGIPFLSGVLTPVSGAKTVLQVGLEYVAFSA